MAVEKVEDIELFVCRGCYEVVGKEDSEESHLPGGPHIHKDGKCRCNLIEIDVPSVLKKLGIEREKDEK